MEFLSLFKRLNLLTIFTGLTADAFTKEILNQLSAISDPKPGRVSLEILPSVQAPFPVVTPKINVDVSFDYKLLGHSTSEIRYYYRSKCAQRGLLSLQQ